MGAVPCAPWDSEGLGSRTEDEDEIGDERQRLVYRVHGSMGHLSRCQRRGGGDRVLKVVVWCNARGGRIIES